MPLWFLGIVKTSFQFLLSVALLTSIAACNGDSNTSQAQNTNAASAQTPPATPPVLPPLDTNGAFGLKTVNMLILRGNFSDREMDLTDQEWRDMLKRNVDALDEYLRRYAYRRVEINYHISEIFPVGAVADNNPTVIANTLKTTYRDRASSSATDPLSNLEDATVFVYSFPSAGIISNAGAIAGAGNMWMPSRNVLIEGFIHEFGHTFELGHPLGVEGATFGEPQSEQKVFTENLKESADGLHMLGSEGDGRVGPNTSYPVPYLNFMGFLPDEFVSNIEADGTYRLYESVQERLPSTDRKIAYVLKARGRPFWFSFSPNMSESWARFDGSDVFENGVIVHWRFQNDLLALLDFTPNSYRSANNISETRHPEELYFDTRDGALPVGTKFTIPETNTIVEPTGTGTEDGIRYIDLRVTGFSTPLTAVGGPEEFNLLVIRGEFSDKKFEVRSDFTREFNLDLWRRGAASLLLGQERYFGLYGFGRVQLNTHVSSVVELDRSSIFTSRELISEALNNGYRRLAATSDDDDLSAIDNATHIIYSTPDLPENGLSTGISSIDGDNRIWVFGNFFDLNQSLKRFGRTFGLDRVQGVEGVVFNTPASDHKIFTEKDVSEGDGLHMLGTEGGAVGFIPPYPLPYINDMGILPDNYVEEITVNGEYRLFESGATALPANDNRELLYNISAAGRKFWITFSPDFRELRSEYRLGLPNPGSESFADGVIVHWEFAPDRLALLDFTPNSYRGANVSTEADHNAQLYFDTRDGALQIGNKFMVPDTAIEIEPIRIGTQDELRFIDIMVSGIP